MAVRVLFCPLCAERTPHEPRRARAVLALASLLALVLVALGWARWVDPLTGTFVLVVAALLALRGIERRWQFLACMRCRERERRAYRRTKPDLRHTIFGGG
jgi:hypothetical protein